MASYEQTLRLFERWCREQLNIVDVDKVTEAVIRRYINDLQERGKYSFYSNDKGKEKNFPDRRRDFRKPISVCTINNYIRNLRVFFNWMDLEGTIRKNPMKKVRQLKDNRKAKEYISDEDFKKLINTDVAEVDGNGTITAIAPGTTTVACSSLSGCVETCEVVVAEPSAIEQLNEYEKWIFDVLVEKILPSFYKPSAARIKQLGPAVDEEYSKNMILEIRIQGENRLGGATYSDYMVLCEKEISESTYLPCFTDNKLFKSPHEWKENTKIDLDKLNNALKEYWESKGMTD